MLNNSVKKIAQQSINMQHNLKIKIYSFKNYKLYLYVFNSRHRTKFVKKVQNLMAFNLYWCSFVKKSVKYIKNQIIIQNF